MDVAEIGMEGEVGNEAVPERQRIFSGLFGGCIAGPSVDIALHPVDTIKTRLQSKQGFFKAGGFNGLYRGLSAAALGSAPSAACFFGTYETTKVVLARFISDDYAVAREMTAGSVGEMVTAMVRMPFEVIKQRRQSLGHAAWGDHFKSFKSFRGLWQGYTTLVAREIPFSFLQFPMYESFKRKVAQFRGVDVHELEAWQASLCGSLAGGLAGAITTPLDVVKTRVVLSNSPEGMFKTLVTVAKTEGIRPLFAGCVPRVAFISFGGAVFFGVYEQAKIFYRTINL
eukprot:m.69746 g.69746  ORF g.69746 m.69746 type:complete len:284 (+) comp8284_c0_seq1:210-1061(+)